MTAIKTNSFIFMFQTPYICVYVLSLNDLKLLSYNCISAVYWARVWVSGGRKSKSRFANTVLDTDFCQIVYGFGLYLWFQNQIVYGFGLHLWFQNQIVFGFGFGIGLYLHEKLIEVFGFGFYLRIILGFGFGFASHGFAPISGLGRAYVTVRNRKLGLMFSNSLTQLQQIITDWLVLMLKC